jgi:hypothetical protein
MDGDREKVNNSVNYFDLSDEELEKLAAARGITKEQLAAARKNYQNLNPDEKRRVDLAAMAAQVRLLPISLEGYKLFYECIWGRKLQPYAEEWADIFAKDIWAILECHRGSGKTTDLTITFNAYCLGKEPWTSSLVLQASDPSAAKTVSTVADIAEYFEGWKACFPNIVPDKEKGWGAEGYYIKDTSAEYSEWLQKCAKDHMKDPSFIGLGISSTRIRGMHPKRLFVDDIHDEKNSTYPRERAGVTRAFMSNVWPILTKPDMAGQVFCGVACTPFAEDDTYHVLADTGLFVKKTTPMFAYSDTGKYELEGKRIDITWEEGFPLKRIEEIKSGYKKSRIEFAREYLCDLSAAKNMLYKWYSYPAEDVDWNAPMVGGVDYASVIRPTRDTEGRLSHFAMAYTTKIPGGAVVVGGIVEQVTQAQAETYVLSSQTRYPGYLRSVIESDGVGAQFIQLLSRNPQIRYLPKRTSEIGRGSKEKRQYEVLSVALENATLRVSDADTPFLNCFRSYLMNYPNIDQHAPEWDVADAVVLSVVGIPELAAWSGQERQERREFVPSPWAAIGKARN